MRDMLIELDVTVDRPPQPVFDAWADLRNEPAWNPQVSAVTLLTGEPVATNSRFAVVVGGVGHHATIRRHTPPRLLEITTTGPTMTTRTVLAFTDGAAGTVVIARFEQHGRGLRRLLEPFRRAAVRAELATRLAAFRSYCET